jgi:hypothetical protein
MVLAQPAQAVAIEGVQVGLHRMGMQSEEAADGGGVPALGIQDDGFGAAQLPAVGGGLQQLPQVIKFSGSGSPSS